MKSETPQKSMLLHGIREQAMAFAGMGLYRFAFDGTILFADDMALRIFELEDWFPDAAGIRGKNIADLVVYKGPKGTMREELRSQGRILRRDWAFRTLKGNDKWVMEDAYLVQEEGTGDESIQVIVRDITERKRTEEALLASERRFRETLENMDLIAVQLDSAGAIRFCNDYLLLLSGWERGEVLNKPWIETFIPAEWRNRLQDAVLGRENNPESIPRHYEYPICTRTGEARNILWSNTLLRDQDGRFTGLTCIGQDITSRTEAEDALRQSSSLYRTTLDNLTEAVHLVDENLHVLLCNSRLVEWNRSLGLRTEIVGEPLFNVYPFLDERVRQEYRQVFASGETLATEEVNSLHGEQFYTETRKIPVLEKGRIARVLTVIRDISGHKRAQLALQESEAKYRAILENIQEGYYEVDLSGNFTFFNSALSRVLGYPEAEIQGMNYRRYYANQEMVRKAEEVYRNVYETGVEVQIQDWPIVRNDGSQATLGVSISLIRDANGQVVGFRGIARDVSVRLEAERALREAEERYRELFENANDIIYTHDLEGCFTSLNKAGERITGYSRDEAMALSVADVLGPESRAQAQEMIVRKLGGDDTSRYELSIRAKDGHAIPVEVNTRLILKDGQPVGIQGIARDITERRQAELERERLEAQIRHSQKLESLGVLAGGIAHDFNNLLVGILGNAGLALTRLHEGSAEREYVKRIESTAQRAAELTNQMLAYTGRGPFVVRPINLSMMAKDMGHLLTASISKKVLLKYECPSELPTIEGDTAQLHQILMNLIVNASDAIGDEPGVITVRTGTLRATRAYWSKTYLADDLPEGPYVVLEVADTGCGMDRETVARIFDPFFSTKFTGRGLGLAAVLGIVRMHRGAINVYSELGHGTTFKVLFPVRTPIAAGSPDTPVADDEAPLDGWRGHGTVLLADDEEGVRIVAAEILEECGFTVLSAANGQEAVSLFHAHAGNIAAVVLDLTMPVMGGREAFQRIRQIRPDVPVILSSGYTEQDASSRFGGANPTGFIQKPFGPSDVLRALRKALSSP